MSLVPSLVALGARVRKLGHIALAADLAHLGMDGASESTTLRVFDRLIGQIERQDAALSAAAQLIRDAPGIDAAAGRAVLEGIERARRGA